MVHIKKKKIGHFSDSGFISSPKVVFVAVYMFSGLPELYLWNLSVSFVVCDHIFIDGFTHEYIFVFMFKPCLYGFTVSAQPSGSANNWTEIVLQHLKAVKLHALLMHLYVDRGAHSWFSLS